MIFGDGAQTEILEAVGLEHCSVLVLTFADPTASLRIVRAVRELRPELPVLVRTQDDAKLEELQQAGATEVVPETLEASLMLVSHVLLLLDVPVSRVVKTVGDIRNNRYAMLRRSVPSRRCTPGRGDARVREELHTVVLPPGAYCVGKIARRSEAGSRRGDDHGDPPRRHRGPAARASTVLREGDVVVLYGTPEALRARRGALVDGIGSIGNNARPDSAITPRTSLPSRLRPRAERVAMAELEELFDTTTSAIRLAMVVAGASRSASSSCCCCCAG